MKITISNSTHWRADHLRAFIKRLLPDERPDLCKRGAISLRVTLAYNRQVDKGSCSGCASIHGNWMKIMVPSQVVDKVDLAHTISHELAHTRGMRHRSMRDNPCYVRAGRWREIFAWADGLPFDRMVERSLKQQPEAKLAHAQQMLKRSLTRERRAVTVRKKWDKRIKALRKKIERSSAPDQGVIVEASK